MSPRPAVFLDRDGTLVEEAGYIDSVERLRIFPWSLDAVRLLNRGGFRVIVITNQAGVAHGYFDEAVVRGLHGHLDAQLRASGAEVDGFYYCPHHPDAALPEYRRRCDCRKPAPGLFLQSAREHHLDLARSYSIGDRWLDVEAAGNAGVASVLVRTGYGASQAAAKRSLVPAHVADNLIDATTWILRQRGC